MTSIVYVPRCKDKTERCLQGTNISKFSQAGQYIPVNRAVYTFVTFI